MLNLGLNLGLGVLGGGGTGPVSENDLLFWGVAPDGDTIEDSASYGLTSAEYVGSYILDFTGVTGGGLDDPSIIGDETVSEFVGTGTQPTITAGRIECAGTNEFHSLTLSSGFKYVASAGADLNCYDVSRTIWDNTALWNNSNQWNNVLI
jgi:hypothetical protein